MAQIDGEPDEPEGEGDVLPSSQVTPAGPGDMGQAMVAPGQAGVSISYEDYLELQKLRKMMQSQNNNNAAPVAANAPDQQATPRLVLSKEENTQYVEFIRLKQQCSERVQSLNGTVPSNAHFKEIGENLAALANKFEDVFGSLQEAFESCESRCNSQWNVNNPNGPKEQIDTIAAMQAVIREYEAMGAYIDGVTQQLDKYLEGVAGTLKTIAGRIDYSFARLRKDGTKPSKSGLELLLRAHDASDEPQEDQKEEKSQELLEPATANSSQIVRMQRELEAERAKVAALEARLGAGVSEASLNDNYFNSADSVIMRRPPPVARDAKIAGNKSVPLNSAESGVMGSVGSNGSVGSMRPMRPMPPMREVAAAAGDADARGKVMSYGVMLVAQFDIKIKAQRTKLSLQLNPRAPASVPVFVCRGSVLDFTGSAIVNATNQQCVGALGVDGAISKAGGSSYQDNVLKLPVVGTGKLPQGTEYSKRLLPGQAALIDSGKDEDESNQLKTKHVILTVGPRYESISFKKKSDEVLTSAYKECMKQAAQHGVKTIGFCLISAGLFRGHARLSGVLEIGCNTVKKHVYYGCEGIYMIAYTQAELNALMNVAKNVFGKPGKVYQSS